MPPQHIPMCAPPCLSQQYLVYHARHSLISTYFISSPKFTNMSKWISSETQCHKYILPTSLKRTIGNKQLPRLTEEYNFPCFAPTLDTFQCSSSGGSHLKIRGLRALCLHNLMLLPAHYVQAKWVNFLSIGSNVPQTSMPNQKRNPKSQTYKTLPI